MIADIPSDAGAVVDIGSRVQAERTRPEAIEILNRRNSELTGIIDSIRKEHDELEKHIVALATRFNDLAKTDQVMSDAPEIEADEAEKIQPTRRPRRKRGTELTLDD